MAANDDWKESTQRAEIEVTSIPPLHDREAAILRTVPPGANAARRFPDRPARAEAIPREGHGICSKARG